MFNKFKRPSFSLLGLFALAAQFTPEIRAFNITQYIYPQSDTKSPRNLVDSHYYINYADQLIKQAWDEISQKTGITLLNCIEVLQTPTTLRKQYPISNQTIALFNEVCADFKINPGSINIINDYCTYLAATDGCTVYIHEKELQRYSLDTQRFILGHELAHCVNKDPMIEKALHKLASNKGFCVQDFDTLRYAMEFRADVTAMLKGPRYSQGAIASNQKEIIDRGDYTSSTYPRPSQMLKIAQEIDTMYSQQGITHAIA